MKNNTTTRITGKELFYQQPKTRNVIQNSEKSNVVRHKKMHPIKKFCLIACVALALIGGLYCTAVFSNIPFIKYYRTLYIETAMTTMTHQWLATAFFPDSVIAEATSGRKVPTASTQVWTPQETSHEEIILETVHSVNENDVPREAESETTEEVVPVEVDILGQKQLEVGGKDWAGNTIEYNDIDEGILISTVHGDTYMGKIAVIDDAARVYLEVASEYGSYGDKILDYNNRNNVILAVNGGGFKDDGGVGNGGISIGAFCSHGIVYACSSGDNTLALTNNNQLLCGNISSDEWESLGVVSAMQFNPAMIVNGQIVVEDSAAYGLQPRTAIGQRADGSMVFAVVDGRQSHSIGITMYGLACIMRDYGCENAGACDGGSSSIMAYNHNIITKCSSPDDGGRYLPNAWVVTSKKENP